MPLIGELPVVTDPVSHTVSGLLKIPDIGDFKDVPIIEILVAPGDTVEKETALVTLETEKASMEIPSPQAGQVNAIQVKVGDKVSEGSVLLTLAVA